MVDSLILCQLVYLRFEHCGLHKSDRLLQLSGLAGETQNQELLNNVPVLKSALLELMLGVANNPRYRWICATQYENTVDPEINKQFSAVTYLFEDGTVYVAFRGTDKSATGWKENLSMLYHETTPSQNAAAAYLQMVAQRFPGPIYIGGHSKGGNLAVYAATSVAPEIQERIVSVFNHDGPGFTADFFDQDGYRRMKERIHKTVPETAVVGMLFRDQENYTVVESTGFAIFQHDMLSWVVKDGELSSKDSVDKSAQQATTTLNALIDSLSMAQRRTIVEAIFQQGDMKNEHQNGEER